MVVVVVVETVVWMAGGSDSSPLEDDDDDIDDDAYTVDLPAEDIDEEREEVPAPTKKLAYS